MTLDDRVNESIRILKIAAEMSELYYQEPLIITYSGGKDSDVLLHLAIRSGINFEVVNSHTTVDAPETVYHIREVFKELSHNGIKATIRMPKYNDKPTSMWKLIVEKKIPPTRLARYCCQVLKESSTPNRYIATGVRGGESAKRKTQAPFEVRGKTLSDAKRFDTDHAEEVFLDAKDAMWEIGADPNDLDPFDCTLIENAKKKMDLICNPIIDWSEEDVWNYIHKEHIKYNPLYDRGYKRVGCVGCPLGGTNNMKKEFNDYPIYKSNYIKAFDRMLEARRQSGKCDQHGQWTSGEGVFNWWVGDKRAKRKGLLNINKGGDRD